MIKRNVLGNSNIEVSAIGFGGAPIGDLFEKLDEQICFNTLKISHKNNINFFDTSPFYGHGLSEHRIGNYLKSINRDDFVLCTKVGRYLIPDKAEKINRGVFKGGLNFSSIFDYSYDGVMRSFEQSLFRLGLSQIDICLIHDVDKWTHGRDVELRFKEAMEGAYKALEKLRSEKVIKGIGVGLNESDMCSRFAEAGDFDCMILAGRYTLLEQGALDVFFPIAKKKNIGIILAGVFNSGILIKGVSNHSTYDYQKIPEHIAKKYFQIDKTCKEYNVPIGAAALQFCNAHEVVSTMILGMDHPNQVKENIDLFNYKINKEFWYKLIENKLINPNSPVPD
ncbi:aldo/keto reductase [Alphaproteobacteria bacterium]|nr:aldo/keto reductase [Alphaproteobacteria bacterium]